MKRIIPIHLWFDRLRYFVCIGTLIFMHASSLKALPIAEAFIPVQEARNVTGVITGENGETLPGVSVLVKGTTTGAVTDVNGRYTLNVPPEDIVLTISSIGYVSQEVSLNGRSVIDITWLEDVQSLEEIVVVGYGVQFVDESITNPGPNNQGDQPWIFIRYAEILLNYAEAMYMLGNEDVAREYINKVRSRPGVEMPDVTDTGAALLERLQHERQIELVFEEHRYFDVRRWKIATVELNKSPLRMDILKDLATGEKTYTVNTMEQFTFVFHERNYLVPIPQAEIDKNGLLEQNPGY